MTVNLFLYKGLLYNGKTYLIVTREMVDTLLNPQIIDKCLTNEDVKRLSALLPDISSKVIIFNKGYSNQQTVYSGHPCW
jgi:hypothetical protein